MANSFLLPLLLCAITIIAVHSQSLPDSTSFNPLSLSAEAEPTCKQTYGFLPCTTTVLGNLFLIIVYGHLMFVAATYLADGSEILLQILGPSVIGGFLPILGALPDAMLILASGLSKSKEVAQSQVSIGMGLLAGSTIVLLTVIWGSCVVVGKCDLPELAAVDRQDTKGFDLTGSGVSTDIWTCYAARIMAISIIPFIIVQLPRLLDSSSARRLAVLIALIVSVSMLISYCVYQVFQPWIQRRRIAYAKYSHVMSGVLKHLRQRALGRLLNDQGEPNFDVIRKLFDAIDVNKDSYLSASELKALIIGIRFDEIDLDQDDAVDKLITDFDTSHDSLISLEEFKTAICKWLNVVKGGRPGSADAGPETIKVLHDYHEQTKHEYALLGAEEVQSDEIVGGVENPKWISFKAGMMLLLGAIIAAAFADPLVDAVVNFSDATSIPSFFVSFIALPLATNSSEAMSVIITASRKKIRTASLTFSELYGNITTNNVVSLSVFLALVYVRELTWDFSAEVLIILIVCLMMAGLASFRTRFPLWTCCVAFILYPFSLALVYVLDYVFGWS